MRRVPGLLAAALLALAGCGSTSGEAATGSPPPSAGASAGAPATGEFNAVDVMFLQMMIAHEAQARDLLGLAASRATRAEVKTLAAAIDVTQATESDTMKAWLRSWNQPVDGPADPGAHAGHGGVHNLAASTVDALRQATGDAFDREFLNVLIGHQHNAIDLARMEATGGVNPPARDLARRVDQSRTAQIEMMLTLAA